MASFNPDVKDIEGNWLNASGGPIKQPHFVSTTGMALESGAKLLDSGLKARDQLANAFITEEARQKIEPMVNQRVADLEATHAALRLSEYGKLGAPNVRVDVNGQPVGVTTPDGATRPVPDEIKQLPRVLETLKGARANGTISQTQFDGEILKVAKDMRSRVMIGDRDMVDAAISKFKNEPTANDYMQGLLKDINSALTHKNKAADHLTNQLLDANNRGVTGAWEAVQERLAGRLSDVETAKLLNGYSSRGFQIQTLADEFKLKDMLKKDSQGDMDDYATKKLSKIATDDNASFEATSGANDPNHPAYKLHTGPINPKLADEIATALQARLPDLAKKMENDLKSPMVDSSGNIIKDKNGREIIPYDVLGPDVVAKKIHDSLALQRFRIDSLTKGDAAPTTYTSRQIKHMQETAQIGLYADPVIGNKMLRAEAVSKLMGSQAFGAIANAVTKDGFLGEIGTYIQSEVIDGLSGMPNPDGTPRTAKNSMERAQRVKGLKPQDGNAFINAIELIEKPETPDNMRAGLVKYAFADRGLIKTVQDKSKYSVYARLTKPEFVEGVKKAGSEAWATYTAWNRDTFGSELIAKDVKSLNSVTVPTGYSIAYENKDGIAQYKILNPRGEDITYSQSHNPKVTDFTRSTIANVNRGLRGLSVVAKTNGDDVDEYLYNTLTKLGLETPSLNQVGFDEHMKYAIIASRKQKAVEDELKKQYPKK